MVLHDPLRPPTKSGSWRSAELRVNRSADGKPSSCLALNSPQAFAPFYNPASRWMRDVAELLPGSLTAGSHPPANGPGCSSETLPITLRSRTDQAQEAAAHRFVGAETAATDASFRRSAFLEHPACGF